MNRRQFLQTATASAVATSCTSLQAPDSLIIDTHQHLWDRRKLNLPWPGGAPEVLRHDFLTADYVKANGGLNVKAIYMEVDVAPSDRVKEADGIEAQCRSGNTPTIAATIGGRPSSSEFESYVKRYAGNGIVKGLRQVLHGDSTPAGNLIRLTRSISVWEGRNKTWWCCKKGNRPVFPSMLICLMRGWERQDWPPLASSVMSGPPSDSK